MRREEEGREVDGEGGGGEAGGEEGGEGGKAVGSIKLTETEGGQGGEVRDMGGIQR